MSLNSHSGVIAAEHFDRGTLAAPGECATVYRGDGFVVGDVRTRNPSLVERAVRGSFDLHKATSGGMTMGTCADALSPIPCTHTHIHHCTATPPYGGTVSACGHAQCCDGYPMPDLRVNTLPLRLLLHRTPVDGGRWQHGGVTQHREADSTCRWSLELCRIDVI